MHCLDVSAVGRAWLESSPALRTGLSQGAELPWRKVQAWVLYFLFLHDFGKADTRFQFKAPELVHSIRPQASKPNSDVRQYDHGGGGLFWFKKDLSIDFDVDELAQWMLAACSHHGGRVDPSQIPPGRSIIHTNDMAADRGQRSALLGLGEKLFLQPEGLTLDDCRHEPPHMFAGFCSVCDWVGSNETFFQSLEGEWTPDEYFERRTETARSVLSQSGLVTGKTHKAGMAALYPGFSPRGVQTLSPDSAIQAEGLTIIEAPTGSGKTEAALSQASRLLAEDKADAIIVALPTQATANAMFERLEKIAPALFTDGANAVLAHGKARFSQRLKSLMHAGKSLEGEESRVQCSQWLAQSRKRIFLGQIGVCTIDQVLMSALPVRHHFVRRFGIGRSVLVIDEVHAYDSYMSGLLRYVLQAQREAGGSAILLSATLDSRRRRELIELWGAPGDNADAPYPLVTRVDAGRVERLELPRERLPEKRTVKVETRTTPEALPDLLMLEDLAAKAGQGQCVAIVVNVVDHAQRLARDLRGLSPGVPVDLFHSRFAFRDRDAIERAAIRDYGKDRTRGRGRILVATQVVEQSLDLDFDYLATQLCPADLLFQRLGRLHRHTHLHEGGPGPACLVLCPEEDDFGVHACIYKAPSLLWRTRRLLQSSERIVFPAAYREWIEPVYSDGRMEGEPDEVYASHGAWRDEQEGLRYAAQVMAVAAADFPDTDQNAARLTRADEMSLLILPYAGGRLLDDDGSRLAELKRLKLHHQEAAHLCAIPAPASWEKWLRGVDVEMGFHLLEVEASGEGRWTCATPSGSSLHYDPVYGLWKEDA